jgi:superfamily II DNA or RNA helicase
MLAEHLLLADADSEAEIDTLLGGLRGAMCDALRAAVTVRRGHWRDGQLAFEAALKGLQQEHGSRKHLLPFSVAWLYPLALLAQGDTKHLEIARKFCAAESGKREPEPHTGWGAWVHAARVRLGDAPVNAGVFHPPTSGIAQFPLFWRILLGAWMGADAPAPARSATAQIADSLRTRLDACGLGWLRQQLDAAMLVRAGGEPGCAFFAGGADGERWRTVLQALRALDTAPARKNTPASRILWAIETDASGAVSGIQPYEQKHGARGWGTPKKVSLGTLAGSKKLEPRDAQVARAIRKSRHHGDWEIDLARALGTLTGHPGVVWADDPLHPVELVEASPEVELLPDGDALSLRIWPPLRAAAGEPIRDYGYRDDEDAREALRGITVWRDGAQRARLVRLSTAQRRAAQLIGDGLRIPRTASAELDAALGALATHFQVGAETVSGLGTARERPPELRLRAELTPQSEAMMLRLVAAPLGADGPRLAPGAGRSRLLTSVSGETLATVRDLAAERAAREAVLDALPFLSSADDGNEWLIEDPEDVLHAVEVLPALPAIAALDWPKGKAVRVTSAGARQLRVAVRSRQDWFELDGELALDEGQVIRFATLLELAGTRSRYIALGDGAYLALTQSLRQRLADLAAVSEPGNDGLRVPRIALGWLEEALAEGEPAVDTAYRAALERLRGALDNEPPLPAGLQAELRPYQEDGIRWALRLAQAGFGGVLADDMGLGKTVQALALLCARGPGGPALVVAPTSVCGNWVREAARFAPGLRVVDYAEARRDTLIGQAGALDVIVVSYALLLNAQERFAARRWHTLIADEAQAVKNADAKRTQALFALEADCRLALSGTPIENRLDELWSIMRFANPGLLGTRARFTARFATPIEQRNDREVRHRLRRLIAPFVLRRTKAQVLDELPPRSEQLLAIEPSPAEAAHYEALRRAALSATETALAESGSAGAQFNVLAQLMRLRRAACDPRLADSGYPAVGAKVEAIGELAAELVANGHKALVFSQFTDYLALLRARMEELGLAYQYLDGATPAAERNRRIARFQAGEGELFLISLKAGGFGLNLTAADYVLITDPWWNPAAEDQALGRAHRMGQRRPVTVYRLVTRGTIEERIVALHGDKRALAESILETDGQTATLPSAEDLLALLRD